MLDYNYCFNKHETLNGRFYARDIKVIRDIKVVLRQL